MSEPNIVSNFGRPAVSKNILSCRPASPVFFRVTMAGNKFVFRQENLLLYLGFSILLKAECESQCNVRCVGKDSSEGWRDRLDGGVREANAEIQPGSYFGRFDTLGDSDHLNSDELVSWTGMRHTASRNACRPGAITKERNRVASRRGGMFWPEHLPVDPERFLKEWLGFGVLAHRFEKEPKVIQGSGGLGLLRTPSALCHFKRPLRNRNRLLIFSLFNQ